MIKSSPIQLSDESPRATSVVDEFRRVHGAEFSQSFQGRYVRANPVTRRFGLVIWALAICCLGLGALVWWQLLRALP